MTSVARIGPSIRSSTRIPDAAGNRLRLHVDSNQPTRKRRFEMTTFQQLKNLCISEDWEEIEFARDVAGAHVSALIDLYGDLESWPQKIAVIQLIQDQSGAKNIKSVMLDVLRAPDVDDWFQDTVELSKAVALGFIDEKFDTFMAFYNDRALLRDAVQQVLTVNGLTQEAAVSGELKKPSGSKATSLLGAIIKNDLAAIREFLKAGVDPNQYVVEGNTKGCTFLMIAIIQEHYDAAWLLLGGGASPTACRLESHQNALDFAAALGHRKLCQYLMDHGATMDCLDNWGGSIVSIAARSGNMEILEDAIQRGAGVDVPYHDGRTAIWFAAEAGKTEAVLRLLDAGVPLNIHVSGSTPLHLACKNNHARMVSALIKRGADVNLVSTCDRRQTPLMMAAEGGYVSIVGHLLKAGADPSLPDKFGRPAVELANGKRADEIRAAFAEFHQNRGKD